MSHPIIEVNNVSKTYRLGEKTTRPDSLFGAATGLLTSPFKNWSRLRNLNTSNESQNHLNAESVLHALKDVSFSLNFGDVLGVIGGNGAGKSTLLKVLSRITQPTTGSLKIKGRISSLLEVGTGFHPELTGRDNIYMNGSIIGMRKQEIDKRFDEIVDFSGVEKFLDTPMKRYSSGMQVRLAFSVAAHIDPEILIVDEVLAVGDIGFQQKCMERMKSIAEQNRTVLFVSHNDKAVRSLCTRAIHLDAGRVRADGTVEQAFESYRKSRDTTQSSSCISSPTSMAFRRARSSGDIEISDFKILNNQDHQTTTFESGESIRISLACETKRSVDGFSLELILRDAESGQNLASAYRIVSRNEVPTGRHFKMTIELPAVPFQAGVYSSTIRLYDQRGLKCYDIIESAIGLPLITIPRNSTGIGRSGLFEIPTNVTANL